MYMFDLIIILDYFLVFFQTSKIAIVKNTPEMNAKLYTIKNIVEIKPIQFPDNLPENADPRHCFLKVSSFSFF